MDLGSADKVKADGLQVMPRNIPLDALPPEMPATTQKALAKHRRPDALLYKPPIPKVPTAAGTKAQLQQPQDTQPCDNSQHPTATPDSTQATYWIAEIKCCRDTDPKPQLEAANTQTHTLANAIKESDPNAEIIELPLLIGVAGTIFASTHQNLETLGVKDTTLKTVLAKASRAAIHHLHKIYKTKLVRSHQLKQPRRRKRKK